MSYPKIEHKDIIAPDALRAMDYAWNIETFQERPVVMSEMANVFVAEEGLVFTSDGDLIDATATQHSAGEVERGRLAVLKAKNGGETTSLDGMHVLCKKRGARNYGHWMCEMLPKAYIAKSHLEVESLRYLTPEHHGGLGRVILDSLDALHIPEGQIVGVGSDVVRIERLVIIDGLTSHGQYMSPLVMNCIDRVSAEVPGAGIEKIFVLRTSSPTRRFVNEAQVVNQALARGYRTIDPGRMCLDEQIAAFKTAGTVVGVVGAEMTNLAFAPRGCRIRLLAPASMPDTFFWFIAGLRGLHYHEIRCMQVGPPKGSASWDRDIVLEEADLESLFES